MVEIVTFCVFSVDAWRVYQATGSEVTELSLSIKYFYINNVVSPKLPSICTFAIHTAT